VSRGQSGDSSVASQALAEEVVDHHDIGEQVSGHEDGGDLAGVPGRRFVLLPSSARVVEELALESRGQRWRLFGPRRHLQVAETHVSLGTRTASQLGGDLRCDPGVVAKVGGEVRQQLRFAETVERARVEQDERSRASLQHQ
jgi:hypothetical protein